MTRFADRRSAGNALATAVAERLTTKPTIVLGLPRGGLPVAFEVAQQLQLPLDVMVVRKVGMPGHEEYAVGAIASGGITVREPHALQMHLVDETTFATLAADEQQVLMNRERLFRAGRPAPALRGQSVLLVDDGLATGSTMRAAILAARQCGASAVSVAVPIASPEAGDMIRNLSDQLIVLTSPADFYAVGQGYVDFDQVDDDIVIDLLQRARSPERELRESR